MSDSSRIELIILNALTTKQEFSRKVLPFIKGEYFSQLEEKLLFETIRDYIVKYGSMPSISALYVEIDNIVDINEKTFKGLKEIIGEVGELAVEEKDLQWLVDNTEKFCQDKALYNAIMDSIQIMEAEKSEKTHKNLTKTGIPTLLQQALGITFDNRVGHDYFKDGAARFEKYNENVYKIPFDIDLLNIITDGGLPTKSLSVILGSTGTGKSLIMCHMAANNLLDGRNVLYITLEMSEFETAKRIDANLLDVDINTLKTMSKSSYGKTLASLKTKTTGRLIVKEYPTASAHTGHFRHLLDELKMKEKFKPDIIYIDYINICLSSRIKNGNNVNSYTYVKSIAEEVRGLAVEFDVPVVTATQSNRSGFGNSDVDLDNVSESWGLPATADLMFAVISNEQLSELGQYMVKQLKNRYNDLNLHKKFLIGVDKAKMKLYNLEDSVQSSIIGGGNQNQQYQQPSTGFNNGMGGNKFKSFNI